MADNLPTQIGRYKVVDELGRGGFARVYRAFDPSVGRPVAIKILTERGKDVLTRFQNEATVAGNLRHENIVTVYEYGEFEGQPYLAMEYLEGEDLQHSIKSRKPLTILEKCTIMSQVASGLDCAHRAGVVHRDVKPSNIMVQRSGVVKIMDFGIARITRDAEATRLTQEGYLLGTLIYMAPEQFAGSEIDALCDIFAYGAVYYELITGRHPFEAPDSRALMYKISFEEPPPIRDFVPDCPPALDAVIGRILHKDRELRYQSLKDVQFDIEPIRLELQRQRASSLVTQAQELFDKKQLDPAQTVVLEALDLDPSNTTARSLKESLQKQLQQRTLQPRIESMLNAGEEYLSRRRFSDAIQSFEAALRLDRDSAYIQSRLEQARALQEHSRVAATLLNEARQEFDNHNLTSAYRSVSEALRHDPQNPEATELLKNIQGAVERRQREQRVESSVQRAGGLILLRSYDEAIALLTALGEDAQSPKVQQLLEWIQKEKKEQDRRQRLQSEMAAATDLLRGHQLVEAATRLTALKAEFTDSKEISDLLAYAQKELEAETRAQAVGQYTAKAAALAREKDFEASMETLEEAMKRFPGENALIRLLGSTMAAKADWERQQAVQTTLRECERLRSDRRFAEAIEMVEATLREYSAEPSLVKLLEELEKAWAQQRRADAVRKATDQARKLLAQNQPGEAVQFLRQSSLQHPDEPVIAELLERAQQEVLAQERAQAIKGIWQQAGVQADKHNFDRALSTVEQGIRAWGEDEALLLRRAEIQSAKDDWEKEKAIRDAVERARQFMARKQFSDAQRLIETALRKYPGDKELAEAEVQVARETEQQKRKEAVLGVASEVRVLISRDRLDDAIEVLRDASQKFPGDADLQAVEQQIRQAQEASQRAQAIERLIKQSDALAAARQYDRAREILEKAVATYPGEFALGRQLNAIKNAAAAWDKEIAVQGIVAEAKAMAQDGRYDTALLHLGSSPVYSPSLLDAQREMEREKDQHERREAIAKAAAGVGGMLERGKTDQAIKLLRELSKQYAGEPQWEPLMARAQEQLAARAREEERKRAVHQALRSAEELASQSRHEEALQLLEEALRQFKDETSLLGMQQRIGLALEGRRRAEAVNAAGLEAKKLLDQERYEDAIRVLRDAGAKYAGEATLQGLLAQVQERLAARDRRNRAVAEAGALFGEGRFEEVTNLLRPLAARYPDDSELNALIQRAQAELDLRQRQAAVAKVAGEAAFLVNAREFDRALAVLDQGLQTWPGEQRLVDARESALQTQLAWQKDQARAAAVQYLRKLAREGRINDGLQKAESLLGEYPGDPDLIEIQKELRMRAILAQAQGLLDQGNPADAVRALGDGAAEYGAAPEWVSLMERATAAAQAQARAAAIERKRREARAKADAGDLDGAQAELEEALRKFPAEKLLLEALESVQVAQALHKRQETVRQALSQCEAMEREGRLPAALQQIERCLHEFPDEPALVSFRKRLRGEIEEQERRRSRQRDREELQGLEEWALSGSTTVQQISEALDLAQRIVARRSSDAEIAAAGAAAIRHFEDIQNAARELEKGNFAGTLEICARYLAARPDHPKFKELQADAERRQKLAYVADLQRRVNAENDLAAKVRLLQKGAELYPGEQWIAGDLLFARNKLSLVESILQKARACEAAGEVDQALEHWNTLATIYDRQPGLDAEVKRLQAVRDRARAEAVSRWVNLIEEQVLAGELGKARDLLRQALTEAPDAPVLQALGKKIDKLRQRGKQARELLSQAHAARQKGDFDECRKCLRQAFQLDDLDAALRRLVLTRLAEHAEAAIEMDWRQAEALVLEAASLDPSFALPGDLLQAIADRKRDSLVEAALSRAEQLSNAGDLRGALAEVESALRLAPDDAHVARLREGLAAQIAAARDLAAAELRSIAAAAQGATVPADLAGLHSRASAIAAEVQGDRGLAALAAQTLREIATRARRLKTSQLWERLLSHRRQIGGIAAGVVLLTVGWIGARELFKRPPSLMLEVRTTPPGAAVMVGTQTCAGPNCRLRLPAGQYVVRAELEGYRPASQPVKLGEEGQSVTVVLEPLQAAARIVTNFPSGRISLDGGPAVELSNGQFALDALKFGVHKIAVTSADGDASVALNFNTAPGQMPMLAGRPHLRNAEAIVFSTLSRSGNIVGDSPDQPVLLDGKPQGTTGADGLRISGLAAGTRELQVGERRFVLGVRPEPEIRILITSDLVAKKLAELSARQAQEQQAAQRQREAQQRDDDDYAAVNKTDPEPVRQFLNGHPKSRHEKEARDLLATLRMQKRIADQQAKKDAKAKEQQPLKDRQAKEQQAKEQQAKEQQAKEQQAKDRQAKEQQAKEQQAKEQQAKEQQAKDRQAKEQQAKEQQAKEQQAKEQQAKEQQAKAAALARDNLRNLELQKEAQRKREAEKADDADWAAVNQGDRSSVEQYRSKHPGGRHEAEANKAITAIKAADSKRQQVLKDQKDDQLRTDREGIRNALRLYEHAFRNKDVAGMRSINHGIDEKGAKLWRDDYFRGASVSAYTLTLQGDPTPNGDRATVRCVQSVTGKDSQGSPLPFRPNVTVELKREPTGWVILSLR